MISSNFSFSFKNQSLILSSLKAIYWDEKQTLILSDLHLGKAGHFRKSGFAIPKSVDDGNLKRLDALIKEFEPTSIFFLGDLFHSTKNEEWNSFKHWRQTHSKIDMHLAVGNHDLYDADEYAELGLTCSNSIHLSPFLMIHDETGFEIIDELYPISGHIHPSVRLFGKGRQSKRLPCFYFGKSGALLPAFGNFTGTHIIKPSVEDYTFAIIDDQILELS